MHLLLRKLMIHLLIKKIFSDKKWDGWRFCFICNYMVLGHNTQQLVEWSQGHVVQNQWTTGCIRLKGYSVH